MNADPIPSHPVKPVKPGTALLDQLPPEQQERILVWLQETSYRGAAQKASAPPPEGLGITTYATAIRRWHRKQLAHSFQEEAQDAEVLSRAAAPHHTSLEAATASALR